MSNEYVYAAELDESNFVTNVIVLPSIEPSDFSVQQYCDDIGLKNRCILTTEDGSVRGKYASIDDRYDEVTDTFISPEPPEPVTD